MKSQVSFRTSGEHTKSLILQILRQHLKGVKHMFEQLNAHSYRIYVAANEDETTVLEVCQRMQHTALYDNTKEIIDGATIK